MPALDAGRAAVGNVIGPERETGAWSPHEVASLGDRTERPDVEHSGDRDKPQAQHALVLVGEADTRQDTGRERLRFFTSCQIHML